MNKIEIKVASKKILDQFAPSSWNECTPKELIYLVRLLNAEFPDGFPVEDRLPALKILITTSLLNITDDVLSAWQKALVKEAEGNKEDAAVSFLSDFQEIAEHVTKFIFKTVLNDDDKEILVIAPDLLRCPYSMLTIKTKKGIEQLYAPSVGKNARSIEPITKEAFDNMTMYELGISFSLYENWTVTKDYDLLRELVATIWRDKKPNTKDNRQKNYGGDVRMPLLGYEAVIPQRKQLISKNLDFQQLDIIAFWFGCCRHHFASLFPDVFVKKRAGENKYGYAGIIIELSRAAFVSKDQIANQSAHDTMMELMFNMEQAKAAVPKVSENIY